MHLRGCRVRVRVRARARARCLVFPRRSDERSGFPPDPRAPEDGLPHKGPSSGELRSPDTPTPSTRGLRAIGVAGALAPRLLEELLDPVARVLPLVVEEAKLGGDPQAQPIGDELPDAAAGAGE